MNGESLKHIDMATTLPEGLRSTTSTGFAALLSVLDAILATQPDSRSPFGQSCIAAKNRILERLKMPGSVPEFDEACLETLRQIVSGPVTALLCGSPKTPPVVSPSNN